jgi:hypothetical protein
MATQWGDSLHITGLVATGDLSAKQFQPVKHASTVGAVKVCDAITDKCIGILNNDPTDGQAADIIAAGNAKVKCETTLAVGEFLSPDSTGYVKVAASANTRIVGFLLEASTGAADIRPMFVAISNL